MTHTERKAVLRSRALARRLAKGADAHARDSRAVCRHIAASDLFRNADKLLLYIPIRGELDLSPLADEAARRGIPIGYPRVEPDGHMTYRSVSAGAALAPGAFGIPAPCGDAEELQPTERTLLLIPALLADRDGYRIGYGGGYFDRYLPTFPGIAALVLPADEVVPCLPTEENDIPVTHIVTPLGWHRCGGQNNTM